MQRARLHLNLLRDAEKLSSSPVRIRVMLPVFALLLCAASAVWWAVLFMQLMLLNGEVRALKTELGGKQSAHAAILAEMARARDLQAELAQLRGYAQGRRAWGPFLAQLADVLPTRVQLTSLEIPEPPPQDLRNPKYPKAPPALGPEDPVEKTSFRLTGRTLRAAPVKAFMETLEGRVFTNWLTVVKAPDAAAQSPRIHSFRQEAAPSAGAKALLSFDIEYQCPARRFAP